MNKIIGLLALSALLTGCTSITNLAPTQYPRDPSGYYRVEAQWNTHREVVRPDSIKPLVVVNSVDTYPMQRVPLVSDRWQAFIPVPTDKDMILYHYKFDFLDDAFGGPRPNSFMSRDYELHVK
jgi:hypothetical protein